MSTKRKHDGNEVSDHITNKASEEEQTKNNLKQNGNSKRTRNAPVRFDDAYAAFGIVYNRRGYSELEHYAISRRYWDQQAPKHPSARHLLFRLVDDTKWSKTSTYSSCRNGGNRNQTIEEWSRNIRAAKLLIPEEERQKHWVEAASLTALRLELEEFAQFYGLVPLRFKSVPDTLKADVLVQQGRTKTPSLWTALQIKSCVYKYDGSMMFGETTGYSMPVLCLAWDKDRNKVMQRLLFPETMIRNSVSIVHDKISRDSDVQAAKISVQEIYMFLVRISAAHQRDRAYWVYGDGQAPPLAAQGLEVQLFCERLLGHEVVSPWEQNMAVDGFVFLYGDSIAVSFKTATRNGDEYQFALNAAPQHEKVQAIVVGFRDGPVVSLGVMSASEIEWDKTNYHWGPAKPFKGVLNVTTGVQLRAALRYVRNMPAIETLDNEALFKDWTYLAPWQHDEKYIKYALYSKDVVAFLQHHEKALFLLSCTYQDADALNRFDMLQNDGRTAPSALALVYRPVLDLIGPVLRGNRLISSQTIMSAQHLDGAVKELGNLCGFAVKSTIKGLRQAVKRLGLRMRCHHATKSHKKTTSFELKAAAIQVGVTPANAEPVLCDVVEWALAARY